MFGGLFSFSYNDDDDKIEYLGVLADKARAEYTELAHGQIFHHLFGTAGCGLYLPRFDAVIHHMVLYEREQRKRSRPNNDLLRLISNLRSSLVILLTDLGNMVKFTMLPNRRKRTHYISVITTLNTKINSLV
jgi:hypothetical protein